MERMIKMWNRKPQPKPTPHPLDPFIEEAEKMAEEARDMAYARRDARATSMGGRAQYEATVWWKFLIQLGLGLNWFWEHILWPIIKFFRFPVRWIGRGWRRVFDWYVYVPYTRTSQRFSSVRAGLMIVYSIIAFMMTIPVLIFILDAAVYLATVHHDEKIYLTVAQEISMDDNIHSVYGCNSLPCRDEDTIYFRIEPSLFNHAWAIAHGHWLFYPDFVAAAVPPGTNECIATTYGVRIKFVARNLDLYPFLLKASCRPAIQVRRIP